MARSEVMHFVHKVYGKRISGAIPFKRKQEEKAIKDELNLSKRHCTEPRDLSEQGLARYTVVESVRVPLYNA